MEKVALIVGVAITLDVGPQRAAEIVMDESPNHTVVEQLSSQGREL